MAGEPYEKVHEEWKDYPNETTPILAQDLDHIETGIKTVSEDVLVLEGDSANFERRPNPARARLQAILSQASVGPIVVMGLGSSTTQGVGASSPDRSYFSKLVRQIQLAYPSSVELRESETLPIASLTSPPRLPGVHGVNASSGGSWSNSYVGSAQLAAVSSLTPRVFVHMTGANDYRTNLITPSQMKSNILTAVENIDDELFDASGYTGLHLICGTYGSPDQESPAYAWEEYLEAMRELVNENPSNMVYLDPSEVFVQAQASGPEATDPYDLISVDLIHATDSGHDTLAAELGRQLDIPSRAPRQLPEAYDRFGRDVLGNLETGQEWTPQATAVYETDGEYAYPTSAGNIAFKAGFSDAEVSAVVTYTALAVAGIIAKTNDASTRIGWYYNGPNNRFELYLGTSALWFSATQGFVEGEEIHLRLRVVNDKVTVWGNGRHMTTHTLTSEQAEAYNEYTQHGLRANSINGNPRFGNFAVRRA